MADSTSVGVAGSPGGGPYVQIWVRIEEGVIVRASYETPGCPSSTAAASLVAQIATGRTVEQARLITGEDVLLILGGLPEGKEVYADLAAQALATAIEGED